MKTTHFAGGCYWCLDAIFRKVRGVHEVVSGFAIPMSDSGNIEGRVEAIKVTYDETKVDFKTLVKLFFSVHDPTSVNRQGNDVGPEYRSVAFYNETKEFETITEVIQELQDEHIFENPIVTQVRRLNAFEKASESHQNYYEKNKNSEYCSIVISPKLAKFRQRFSNLYAD